MGDNCVHHQGLVEQLKAVCEKSDLKDSFMEQRMNDFDKKIDSVKTDLSAKIDNLEKTLPEKINQNIEAKLKEILLVYKFLKWVGGLALVSFIGKAVHAVVIYFVK